MQTRNLASVLLHYTHTRVASRAHMLTAGRGSRSKTKEFLAQFWPPPVAQCRHMQDSRCRVSVGAGLRRVGPLAAFFFECVERMVAVA